MLTLKNLTLQCQDLLLQNVHARLLDQELLLIPTDVAKMTIVVPHLPQDQDPTHTLAPDPLTPAPVLILQEDLVDTLEIDPILDPPLILALALTLLLIPLAPTPIPALALLLIPALLVLLVTDHTLPPPNEEENSPVETKTPPLTEKSSSTT